jgi:hypothetical protein
MLHSRTGILCAALLLSVNVAAPAGDNARGAVAGAQREQIRRTLLTKHTEVEFKLKTTKKAKDFNPQVGAQLPKGINPDGLPSLTQQIPQLADYGYVKMKDQILLVNGLTGKIAEIITETETQPQTTGQQ